MLIKNRINPEKQRITCIHDEDSDLFHMTEEEKYKMVQEEGGYILNNVGYYNAEHTGFGMFTTPKGYIMVFKNQKDIDFDGEEYQMWEGRESGNVLYGNFPKRKEEIL